MRSAVSRTASKRSTSNSRSDDGAPRLPWLRGVKRHASYRRDEDRLVRSLDETTSPMAGLFAGSAGLSELYCNCSLPTLERGLVLEGGVDGVAWAFAEIPAPAPVSRLRLSCGLADGTRREGGVKASDPPQRSGCRGWGALRGETLWRGGRFGED